MLKVCNINIENRERINTEIKKLAERIKKIFHAEVYIFGSFAKREIHEGSDIDFIVVGDFKGKMPERIGKILELTDLPIEPFVYTPEEFQRLKKSRPFIKEILKTGKKL